MLRFFLNKLALIVPTLIGITICAFGFVRLLPGDPILALAGEHGVSAERYEQLKVQFGFDRPIWEQYFKYIGDILHGGFGTSIETHRPASQELLTPPPAPACPQAERSPGVPPSARVRSLAAPRQSSHNLASRSASIR